MDDPADEGAGGGGGSGSVFERHGGFAGPTKGLWIYGGGESAEMKVLPENILLNPLLSLNDLLLIF